jgi:hypothetical protein
LSIGSGRPTGSPLRAAPHRPYRNHHHGTPVRVGATWCVVHRVGATRCVAHRVRATHRVAPTCRTPPAVPQPSPRHAGSRRGDAVRRPSHRVVHRVGATRCVAHRVRATQRVAPTCRTPSVVPQPSPRHAGSRWGNAVRRPLRCVAHRVGATWCVAQNGRGTACRAPTGRTPSVVPQPSPRHAGLRRDDAVRRPLRASPIGSGRRGTSPIAVRCPSCRGDVVRCPRCVAHCVGATRCVAHCVRPHRVGLPITCVDHCVRRPLRRVAHCVGATQCVAQNGRGTACRAPTCRTPSVVTQPSPRHAGSRRGDVVRRPLRCVAHRVRATRRVAPTCRAPTCRTPTITTACRFASGRRGASPAVRRPSRC